jgi:hypothetical protein
MSKKLKPSLQIHAFVDTMPVPDKSNETKYLKEDLKRCKEECAQIEKVLSEWVPEDVAARAEKSLRAELKRKHSRMVEMRASLKALESEEDDEEDDE